MNEKQLTDRIVKCLNELDKCFVYKRFGASGNEIGKPDVTGAYCGIRVEIEVKAPAVASVAMRDKIKHFNDMKEEEKLGIINEQLVLARKLQRYHIKKFQSVDCISGVVLSVEQALWLVTHSKLERGENRHYGL